MLEYFNVIIYHLIRKGFNCPDGICAAWIASLVCPNAKIIGCTYIDKSKPASKWDYPELKPGDKVLVLDFSFPYELLSRWERMGVEIQIIDHHKTAMHDLANFSNAIFNMDKSGSLLTWEYLHKDKPIPEFVKHVDARDLWYKTPESRWWEFSSPLIDPEYQRDTAYYHEAMRIIGRSFELFNKLAPMNSKELREFLLPIGKPELSKKIAIVESIAERVEFIKFCGNEPVCHVKLSPQEDRYVSDAGNCLYLKHPEVKFAAILTSDNTWSLRSNKFGLNFDVGSLARQYGGGGHHNAAGMKNRGNVFS